MSTPKQISKAIAYALSTYAANEGSVMNNAGGDHVDFKDIYDFYLTGKVNKNLDTNTQFFISNLINKTEQNAHFLPKLIQEQYYKERGWRKDNSRPTKALFKKELGRLKDVNTYVLNDDVIDRKKLRVVGNIHGLNSGAPINPDYQYLSDPLYHSAIIYQDSSGNYYVNSVDLNNYSKYGLKKAIKHIYDDVKGIIKTHYSPTELEKLADKYQLELSGRESIHSIKALLRKLKYYNGFRDTDGGTEYGYNQILAEAADIIGNPAIVETGILPLTAEGAEYLSNFTNNKKLLRHLNTYIGSIPDTFTYKGDSIEPVVITPDNKKFGGKLRYGWGGITSQNSVMRQMIYNPHSFGLTAANFTTESTNNAAGFRDMPEYTLQFNNDGNHNNMGDVLDNWYADKELEAYDHKKTKRKTVKSKYFYTDVSLDDVAIQTLNNYMNSQRNILLNMNNRMDSDINTSNSSNNNAKISNINPTINRYGGKLRFYWGGKMTKEELNKDMYYNPQNYNLPDKDNDKDKHSDAYYNIYGFSSSKRVQSENITRSYDKIFEDAGRFYDPETDSIITLGVGTRRIRDDYYNSQNAILLNMHNRMDQDALYQYENANKNTNNIKSRYGGILIKPRFDYGGYYNDYKTPQIPYASDYSMNDPITASDIPDYKANAGVEDIRKATILKGAGTGAGIGGGVGGLAGGIGATILGTSLAGGAAGAAGGAAAGAAGGAAAGAAAGAVSTAWIPIIGPLVALIGAGLGAGIGALSSRKKAKEAAEQQRMKNKQLLAQQQEEFRQIGMRNAQNRSDADLNEIYNMNYNYNMNQGFYGKYGGLIKPRMKYANGGTILPNSNNTSVAFGRTHEQMNPITGETGVAYGNAEVEGGGYINGRELPGEVVRSTPNGDEVFSDSIVIDKNGNTIADYAKIISDRKGIIEQNMDKTRLSMERDIKNLNTSRLPKAKTGTLIRNIEKKAALFNKYTAESVKLDSDLEKLFAYQEQMATSMGLREDQPMRYGGPIRSTYGVGGWLAPVLSFGANALTSGLQYWTNTADAKYKQEILNMLAERKLPKRAKEEAVLLDAEYDITPELNATEREARRIEKHILDNVVNPQQARNLISNVRLDKLEQQNKLRGIKKSEEKNIVNKNIASIIATRNKNRNNEYQDLLDQFNYDTNIAVEKMMINSQETQATQQLLRDLGQSATQAAEMYMASKTWAPGVRKDMNGNTIGGNFKRMSNDNLKNHRYSRYVGNSKNGMTILTPKNQLPTWFNKTRATNWYKQMLKRGLFQ